MVFIVPIHWSACDGLDGFSYPSLVLLIPFSYPSLTHLIPISYLYGITCYPHFRPQGWPFGHMFPSK